MIVDKEDDGRMHIDLTGPRGNAFVLLGIAQDLCKRCGISQKESDEMQKDMESGDYDNLVNVMDGVFGDLIVFYR